MSNTVFSELDEYLYNYNATRKNAKRIVKMWLNDKGYYSYYRVVLKHGDLLKLISTHPDYKLPDELLNEFMEHFGLTLVSVKESDIENHMNNPLYPEGKSWEIEYKFTW